MNQNATQAICGVCESDLHLRTWQKILRNIKERETSLIKFFCSWIQFYTEPKLEYDGTMKSAYTPKSLKKPGEAPFVGISENGLHRTA